MKGPGTNMNMGNKFKKKGGGSVPSFGFKKAPKMGGAMNKGGAMANAHR